LRRARVASLRNAGGNLRIDECDLCSKTVARSTASPCKAISYRIKFGRTPTLRFFDLKALWNSDFSQVRPLQSRSPMKVPSSTRTAAPVLLAALIGGLTYACQDYAPGDFYCDCVCRGSEGYNLRTDDDRETFRVNVGPRTSCPDNFPCYGYQPIGGP